jgi:hypothetical protein
MSTKKKSSTPKSTKGKVIEMGRRIKPQLRFDIEDYEALIELAIQEGYITTGDVSRQPKVVKSKVEGMIIENLLGGNQKEFKE